MRDQRLRGEPGWFAAYSSKAEVARGTWGGATSLLAADGVRVGRSMQARGRNGSQGLVCASALNGMTRLTRWRGRAIRRLRKRRSAETTNRWPSGAVSRPDRDLGGREGLVTQRNGTTGVRGRRAPRLTRSTRGTSRIQRPTDAARRGDLDGAADPASRTAAAMSTSRRRSAPPGSRGAGATLASPPYSTRGRPAPGR